MKDPWAIDYTTLVELFLMLQCGLVWWDVTTQSTRLGPDLSRSATQPASARRHGWLQASHSCQEPVSVLLALLMLHWGVFYFGLLLFDSKTSQSPTISIIQLIKKEKGLKRRCQKVFLFKKDYQSNQKKKNGQIFWFSLTFQKERNPRAGHIGVCDSRGPYAFQARRREEKPATSCYTRATPSPSTHYA